MTLLSKLKDTFTSKEVTKNISFLLDECLPPLIRDQRWFFTPIIRLWNPKMDADFKRRAVDMTDQEIQEAYEKLVPMRRTDMTRKTTEFVLSHLIGQTMLEVGCGNGDISIACAEKGYKVMATDIAAGNLEQVQKKLQNHPLKIPMIAAKVAHAEYLPFENDSFDLVLCLHTLEHIKNLYVAIAELKRVARKRIIVIVPRQRYYRYTCDYHLHFFWNPEQLLLAMDMKKAQCSIFDNSLCYIGDIDS